MAAAGGPIEPSELAGLFAGLREGQADFRTALAVSGGIDSTALMVLFADWLRLQGTDFATHIVLTVDHRLRPEAAAEARQVADRAAALGFRHATLVWDGEKPATGIQAAARAARYRLMSEHLAARGIATLLTAHTRDDQAETLLMRLARGSGLDGLAGIGPEVDIAPATGGSALRLVRPLLGVAKERLRATLEARGIGWTEDPSNASPVFERVRLRAARRELDALGLSEAMLALSARRLQRARVALEAVIDGFCAPEAGIVQTDPVGSFRIDRARLAAAPEEIMLRVIGRCITAAGGSGGPVSLAKLELIVARLREGDSAALGGWTLARARVVPDSRSIRIEREPGRLLLPSITLAAGTRTVWDGRFIVAAGDALADSIEVRALGNVGLAALAGLGRAVKAAPSALRLAPALWRRGDLVAVPALRFWADAGLQQLVRVDFAGLRYNSAPGAMPQASAQE